MLIYQPKGRAGEYSKWALNFYKGCTHGCKYCYVPLIRKVKREEFHSKAELKKGFFEKFEKELKKQPKPSGNVLLSFTSDAYQPIEAKTGYTRRILEMLNEHNINFTILTKNKLAQRDFDLYKSGDEFAMTLTYVDPVGSKRIEPGASLPQERIDTLKKAKERGIRTWVSLEPVIWPEQTLDLIDLTHEFVDQYKVGTINYSKQKQKIDWQLFADNLKEKLFMYEKEYYIKEDLRPYFNAPYIKTA